MVFFFVCVLVEFYGGFLKAFVAEGCFKLGMTRYPS